MNRAASRWRISLRQHMRPVPFRGDVLKGLIRRALGVLGATRADLRILVVDDGDMKRWNARFLGRDRTTNVLSFPECEPEGRRAGEIAGDILLSAPACLSQTRDWNCSVEERVFFFIVHGLVHLAGYDHEGGRTEAARMRKEEIRVYRSSLKEGRSPL